MRYITSFLAILFIASGIKCFAQSAQPAGGANMPHKSYQSLHGRPKGLVLGHERMMAEAAYYNNGAVFLPSDSFIFVYSDGRNYDSVLLTPACDTLLGLGYNSITGTYSPIGREIQTFDANNNMLSILSQKWDTVGSDYVNNVRLEGTYDGHNNLLTFTLQNWDRSNSTWIYAENQLYTYDVNNNQLSFTEQYWNFHTASWRNSVDYLSEYNASNLRTDYITQDWDTLTSMWINQEKDSTTYDGQNQKTQFLIQTWDAVNQVWDNEYINTYAYTGTGQVLLELEQNWTGSSWVNYAVINYFYDVNNNDSLTMTRDWVSSAWVNQYQDLYTWDVNQNELSDIYQTWDAVHSLWTNVKRTRNTYDADNNITSTVTDEWNAGGFWQATVNDNEYFYYYQNYFPTDISTLEPKGSLQLYPSPASAILHIDLSWDESQPATIAIYDASGRLWQQWQVPGTSWQSNIPVAGLPAGTYYISAKSERGQLSKAFSIIH